MRPITPLVGVGALLLSATLPGCAPPELPGVTCLSDVGGLAPDSDLNRYCCSSLEDFVRDAQRSAPSCVADADCTLITTVDYGTDAWCLEGSYSPFGGQGVGVVAAEDAALYRAVTDHLTESPACEGFRSAAGTPLGGTAITRVRCLEGSCKAEPTESCDPPGPLCPLVYPGDGTADDLCEQRLGCEYDEGWCACVTAGAPHWRCEDPARCRVVGVDVADGGACSSPGLGCVEEGLLAAERSRWCTCDGDTSSWRCAD